jgi:hypothetical protein
VISQSWGDARILLQNKGVLQQFLLKPPTNAVTGISVSQPGLVRSNLQHLVQADSAPPRSCGDRPGSDISGSLAFFTSGGAPWPPALEASAGFWLTLQR